MSRETKSSVAEKDVQAQLDAIFRAAVDGVIVINGEGIIQLFNPGAEKIFGYSAAEVVGRNVSELMPTPDKERHGEYIARYIAGGEPQIIGQGREVIGLRADGQTFPMELSVGDASTDEGNRFVGIVKDITQRRTIENELLASEREHRVLFDQAPVGVFTANLDGTLINYNNIMADLQGHTGQEGVRCEDFVVPENRSRLRRALERLRSGSNDNEQLRVRCQNKHGEEHHVELRMSIIRTSEPFIIGHVADHSEEIAAQAELRNAQRQLAQVGRVATLGEMASAIAHEINQPLTAIAAYAQACQRLIEAADYDPDTINASFSSIYDQAMRAGQVVHRIRAFVRDRESSRTIENINDTVISSVELAQFDATESDVEINLDLSSDLPAVHVDRVQIQQVCLNLLRNAIDALVESKTENRQILILTAALERGVEVSFADNGPGISAAVADTLFQPFKTTKEQGMGMGLSISHSIISNHDGRLYFSSREDGGAIFTFEIPADV
ncbi:MAG: PAS domain S-box protein [Pseudomonadota bacterium]